MAAAKEECEGRRETEEGVQGRSSNREPGVASSGSSKDESSEFDGRWEQQGKKTRGKGVCGKVWRAAALKKTRMFGGFAST